MRRIQTHTYCTLLVLGAAIISADAGAQKSNVTARASASGTRLDHRELAADQQVIHALSRLTFGARPGDVQKVRGMGLDKWIEQQLRPEGIDNSSLESFLRSYSILNQDQNDLLKQYAVNQRDRRMAKRAASDTARGISREDSVAFRNMALNRRSVVGQLQSARVARAVSSNRQLEEVMVDFWLNHFSVFAQKGPPEPFYLASYERDAVRPNAMGKFRDLLGAVAKSPAMLFYLDNARSMADSTRPRLASLDRNRGNFGANTAGGMRSSMKGNRMPSGSPGTIQGRNRRIGSRGGQPEDMDEARIKEMQQRLKQLRKGGLNENYGRELLELHTLGVDGGYTQQDVINVARALTGWTIKPPQTGGGFIFRAEMHDAGEKIVLGHRLPAGRGIEEGEQVLDIVARHPATARYIATKLARRFVSDDPPKALVDEAAAVFLRTDGDIRAVVRSIITSNEFFSRRAFRAKVKSPFEVVISAMRALDAKPDSTARTAQAVAYLGQPIYGHQAPNGYPETGESWMNSGAILNRINFGMSVGANRIPGADVRTIPDIDALQNAPREKQVDAVVAMLLGGSASPDTRAVLLSGENPLMAKSDAASTVPAAEMNGAQRGKSKTQATGLKNVEAGSGTTGNAIGMNDMNSGDESPRKNGLARGGKGNARARMLGPATQLTGIAQIIGLALGSPEFQRR